MERQAKDGTIYKKVGSDEWEPITRTAKDGTVYKKVGTDQWSPFETEQADSNSGGILEAISSVGKAIDSYTGAPTRAAIGAMQDGRNPLAAAKNQFGENPDLAPTGKDIAAKAGLSTQSRPGMTAQQQMEHDKKYSPNEFDIKMRTGQYRDLEGASNAGAAGFAIDLAADPLNAIPFGAISKGLGKAIPVAGDVLRGASEARQAQKAAALAEAGGKSAAMIKGGATEVEQAGKLFDFKAPKSLDELKTWKPQAGAGETVGKGRLQEIEARVPDLQTKPLKYHYDMLENPKSMKELKLQFENLPTEDAKRIAAYNQEMVHESTKKINEVAEELAGGTPRSMPDAGNDFISAAKQKYQLEKEMLGPAFNEIERRSKMMNKVASQDLIQALGENTKLKNLLEVDKETSRMRLMKNTPRTGLSDAEHSMLARVVDDLNDGMTFKELQETREFLRKAVDPTNPGASSEINKVRSILLGQLEHMASDLGPDVGQTFKAYAVNERSREALEKIIGGSIDSLDAMYAANPDKVVGKVFSNPNHAKLVAEYVGPEKMRELAAAFVQQGIDKANDGAKGFSPEKFRSWLKTNRNFVAANLDKATGQRLNDLADYGYFGKRFLDEVNPSGTAASLKAMLEPGSFTQRIKNEGIVGAVATEVATRSKAALKQRSATRAVNEMMGAPRGPTIGERIGSIDAQKLESRASKAQGANAASRSLERSGGAMAADNEKQRGPKGPTKWAADGVAKVLEHDKSLDTASVEGLSKTEKGRRLLVKASDLKPRSKAMNKMVEQIKLQIADGAG